MYFDFFNEILQSPTQAANTFTQLGGQARQRNVFLVRFLVNGMGYGQTAAGSPTVANLTFAAKSIDRPRVNTQTQEVNEYNKKRQVFTGYKLEPVRVQFYDSADGAAQNMWTSYARYHFGDLRQGGEKGYHYSATQNDFLDNGQGFGFTASNAGSTDGNGQFFFREIDIFHFYDQCYDEYRLINPRIQQWEPDDLDYSNSEVSLINASFVYENLQYVQQQVTNPGQFSEFEQGPFFGNPVVTQDFPFPMFGGIGAELFPSNPLVGALLGAVTGNLGVGLNFRFGGSPSSGALGMFGNFSFGPYGSSTSLGLSVGGTPLATAFSMGAVGDPLAGPAAVYGPASAYAGINGATYDYMAGLAMAASSGQGNVGQILTRGLLAGAAMGVANSVARGVGGALFAPQVYGAINTQQTGTAMYGYNTGGTQGSIDSKSFDAPPNDGPYSPYQPAGIYGRYGITAEPLAPPDGSAAVESGSFDVGRSGNSPVVESGSFDVGDDPGPIFTPNADF